MKTLVVCCLLAVGFGAEVKEKARKARSNCYDGAYPSPPAPYMPPLGSYMPPAYNPPSYASVPCPPTGTYSAPPVPIVYTPPKPTVTTILIHNAEAPPPKTTPSPYRRPYSGGSSSYSAPSPYGAPAPYNPPTYSSPSSYNPPSYMAPPSYNPPSYNAPPSYSAPPSLGWSAPPSSYGGY